MPRAGNRVALIVDDDSLLARAVASVLQDRFQRVFTARTPLEAEAILMKEPVTHLLCDHDLGRGVPTGAQLIPRWRIEFPSIARAVIFSGSARAEIDLPVEVDLFLAKPVGTVELFEAFSVEIGEAVSGVV